MPCPAHLAHCTTLQHTATHCNTLQHTSTHCNTLQHTTTHCNTLQRTATHCNTLQHTATHCNTLHISAMPRPLAPCASCTLQHPATHCNTLQHTATHRNTLHYTATHCKMVGSLLFSGRWPIILWPPPYRSSYMGWQRFVGCLNSHFSEKKSQPIAFGVSFLTSQNSID